MATGQQPRPKDCLSLHTVPFKDDGATGVLLCCVGEDAVGWVVGFVRRRGWGHCSSEYFLFQWNVMCRSVTVKDVEAQTFGLGVM